MDQQQAVQVDRLGQHEAGGPATPSASSTAASRENLSIGKRWPAGISARKAGWWTIGGKRRGHDATMVSASARRKLTTCPASLRA
jgi:hypothetical protein